MDAVNPTVSWWNGNAYDAHDDATPGMEGSLGDFQSHWLRVLSGSDGHTVKLLIPATPSIQTGQVPKDLPWYAHLIDWLIPSAQAANDKIKGADKLKEHKALHAAANRGKPDKPDRVQPEWYVRLIVTQATLGLVDRNSVFGQLQDSSVDFDSHDLEEKAPFGDTWLTVVFPHPDWGDHSANYASDFHPLPAKSGEGDRWDFEIHSDDPGRVPHLQFRSRGVFRLKNFKEPTDVLEVLSS